MYIVLLMFVPIVFVVLFLINFITIIANNVKKEDIRKSNIIQSIVFFILSVISIFSIVMIILSVNKGFGNLII